MMKCQAPGRRRSERNTRSCPTLSRELGNGYKKNSSNYVKEDNMLDEPVSPNGSQMDFEAIWKEAEPEPVAALELERLKNSILHEIRAACSNAGCSTAWNHCKSELAGFTMKPQL